jgi:hypothetical protein
MFLSGLRAHKALRDVAVAYNAACQTCLAPLFRTAFRPDMINLIIVVIREYKYVNASTLCVGIVVSAPFLRWPGTDRLLSTALHNASVDEASEDILNKTRNNLF